MKTTIKINNLKCCGCANTIKKGLLTIQGVFAVNINHAENTVEVEHTDETNRETICKKLLEMGYSETGSIKGFSSVKANAKSYVSCAIGRMRK